jgi:peptidoglycan/LPS O-acetylase OafA/YrhL
MTPIRSCITEELEPATRDEQLSIPRPHGHIPALDGVRGLAILMVTAFRFFPAYDDASFAGRVLSRTCELGVRGVDLFFVLSGFLITGILLSAKGQPHYFRNFYARRALRIFPLYYGVLLLTLVLLPVIGLAMPSAFAEGAQRSPWLWLYGTNLLVAWKGEWCFGAFNHFWSLAVEEHFYFVWPLVIFLCSRVNAIRVCFGVIGLSFVARAVWFACGGNDITAETLTLFRLDALALGGLLALVARGPNGLRKLRPWAMLCGAVLLAVMMPPIVLPRRLPMLRDSMYALLFGSMIVLAVTAPAIGYWGRFWNARPLRFVGKYSYAMYVVQNFLKALCPAQVFVAALAASAGSVFWARCGYLALMSLATLLLALVSWHVLEKHFLRLKSQFDDTKTAKREVFRGSGLIQQSTPTA